MMSVEKQRISGIEELATAYFKLLSSIDWEDEILIAGLREGLNKFLSNAHLAAFRGRNKYHKTHYVTRAALKQLEDANTNGLIWEHLVPKSVYIQNPCEERAREGSLTVEFVRERLRKHWHLATITVAEDRMLNRLRMPENWDGMDVQARYRAAGLNLVPNPFFRQLVNRPRRGR